MDYETIGEIPHWTQIDHGTSISKDVLCDSSTVKKSAPVLHAGLEILIDDNAYAINEIA